MDGDKSTGQQPADGDVLPSRPQKFQPKLLEKISHHGTDTTSFRFARSDEQRNYYLNYKAGQYSVVDLGTKEDLILTSRKRSNSDFYNRKRSNSN